MSRATSPSAMPFTSSGCRPQKSAICSKVREVLSTSQTAVALGIRISVMGVGPFLVGEEGLRTRVLETAPPGLSAGRLCPRYSGFLRAGEGFSAGHRLQSQGVARGRAADVVIEVGEDLAALRPPAADVVGPARQRLVGIGPVV